MDFPLVDSGSFGLFSMVFQKILGSDVLVKYFNSISGCILRQLLHYLPHRICSPFDSFSISCDNFPKRSEFDVFSIVFLHFTSLFEQKLELNERRIKSEKFFSRFFFDLLRLSITSCLSLFLSLSKMVISYNWML